MEQLGRDGQEEEVVEEGEGQGERTHSRFGGNVFLKSRLILIRLFCSSCSGCVFLF